MKKSETKNEELRTTKNEVFLVGDVKKILFQNDKVVRFTLVTYEETKNGRQAYNYVTCVAFGDLCLEENDTINVCGKVTTEKNEYKGTITYNMVVMADSVDEV